MQIKNQFDYETLQKIGRGCLIAGTGAAALFILDAVGSIEAGGLAPVIAALVPILVNMVREYMKGESVDTL